MSVKEERLIRKMAVKATYDEDLPILVLNFAHTTALTRLQKLLTIDLKKLPFLSLSEVRVLWPHRQAFDCVEILL